MVCIEWVIKFGEKSDVLMASVALDKANICTAIGDILSKIGLWKIIAFYIKHLVLQILFMCKNGSGWYKFTSTYFSEILENKHKTETRPADQLVIFATDISANKQELLTNQIHENCPQTVIALIRYTTQHEEG